MASALVFTTFGVCQVEMDFPHMPEPLKGHPEMYRSVAGLMSSYDYLRGMIVSVFSLLSSFTLERGYAAQEVSTKTEG